MGTGRGNRGGAAPAAMRQHDADGVSPEACAVIRRHGLDRGRVPGWADRCGVEEGVDFNLAPRADLENAPPGRRLARMVDTLPAFDPLRERLGRSLRLFDYGASGGIMDEFLRNCIVERAGKGIYAEWRRYAEMLEGLNVSLFRAAGYAARLRRFVPGLGELANYRNGRRRREGDAQDRVSTTAGASNFHLDEMAAAMVTCDAGPSTAGRSLFAARRTRAARTRCRAVRMRKGREPCRGRRGPRPRNARSRRAPPR